jgi:hypothetical protein
MAEIRVNKIQAAQRQVDAAIRMLFSDEDPIAIHTLVSAALGILRPLAERNPDCKIHKMTKDVIKPNKQKEFFAGITRAYNYFKHADRDPEDVLQGVQEEANDHLLFLASLYYQGINGDWTKEMQAFIAWYASIYPNHTILEPFVMAIEMVDLRKQPRKQQLRTGMSLLTAVKGS